MQKNRMLQVSDFAQQWFENLMILRFGGVNMWNDVLALLTI